MNKLFGPGLGMVAGIAIGVAAVQGLHAQTKPPAYVVSPILKINNAAAFKAGVIDRASEEHVKESGGHYIIRSQKFIIRSQKFIGLDGSPPERLIVIAFDSVEKAQAWENSTVMKEVTAGRLKSTNSLSFIVQGMLRATHSCKSVRGENAGYRFLNQ